MGRVAVSLVAVVACACQSGGAPRPAAEPTPARAAAAPQTPPEVSPERARDLTAFLVGPAEDALDKRQYPLAAALHAGLVAARGAGDPFAGELARALKGAGYDPAQLAVKTSPMRAPEQAAEALALGRRWLADGQHADALLYLRVALALDPTEPAPILELGRAYETLGFPEHATQAYLDYLNRVPMGPARGDVLTALRELGGAGELGTLDVTSSLECEEVWVEGLRVPDGLPIEDMELAPGTYRWLCYSGRYSMAYFERAEVAKGESSTLAFTWAVLRNELANPAGSIWVEHPAKPGTFQYLGINRREVGVRIPKDGSPLRIRLADASGKTREQRNLDIEPGQIVDITWTAPRSADAGPR